MTLREQQTAYQKLKSREAAAILKQHHIVYIQGEPRVGKTLTGLRVAQLIGSKRTLFVTKLQAIPDIELAHTYLPFTFGLDVINYESLHKVDPSRYDHTIADEAHVNGAYPKPTGWTKKLQAIVGQKYLTLMSGTPTPESYSQIYHQMWLSYYNPFNELDFYKWAKGYVNVTQQRVAGGRMISNYKDANRELIDRKIGHLYVVMTRAGAGFSVTGIEEEIVEVEVDSRIHTLAKKLFKDRFYKLGSDGSEIIADTSVKLQNKLHQIYSGTVITEEPIDAPADLFTIPVDAKSEEDNETERKTHVVILDKSKAEYIRDNYRGKKLVIFYKYKGEGVVLREVLPNNTDNAEEFESSTDKVFICQIQSGAMGINLSSADYLIYYNIDFSAMRYEQSQARLLDMTRDRPAEIHYLFARGGIEHKILEKLKNKKSYTSKYFEKDYKNELKANEETGIRKQSAVGYYQRHKVGNAVRV